MKLSERGNTAFFLDELAPCIRSSFNDGIVRCKDTLTEELGLKVKSADVAIVDATIISANACPHKVFSAQKTRWNLPENDRNMDIFMKYLSKIIPAHR